MIKFYKRNAVGVRGAEVSTTESAYLLAAMPTHYHDVYMQSRNQNRMLKHGNPFRGIVVSISELADVALFDGNNIYKDGPVEIWYVKEEFTESYLVAVSMFGVASLEQSLISNSYADLEKTHVKVGGCKDYFAICGLEQYFSDMQAEEWTPNGEATDFLLQLGVDHASMRCGDIIVTPDTGYMVDNIGYFKLFDRPKLQVLK